MKLTGSGIDARPMVKASGITIAEVARNAGHGASYVNHLLAGRLTVTVEMAKKLEAASGVDGIAKVMCGFDPVVIEKAS